MQDCVEILKRLVSYPSVTPLDCGIYEYIATLLPDFKRFVVEKNGVKNVLFYYIPPKFLENIESNLQDSKDSKLDSKNTQEIIESKSQDSKDSKGKNIESKRQDFTLDSKDSKKDSNAMINIESKTDFIESNFTNAELKAFKSLKHFCFAGHVDVVAPGGDYIFKDSKLIKIDSKNTQENIESKSQDSKDSRLDSKRKNIESNPKDSTTIWKYPPFSPTLQTQENTESKTSFLYGRGTQDMKGGIACFLHAIITSLDSIKSGKKIISILLTSDEEGEGTFGTQYMLQILKEKNLLPHYAIVAEPTSEKIAGDTIKVGRRGSINGVIIIHGKQGHVAYPEKCVNPLELLGARLGSIAGVNLDSGDSNFAPSKLVITDIRGGIEAVNVTPSELKIMFNVRNSTLSNVESVKSYVKSALKGVSHELSLRQTSKSFIAKKDSKLVKLIESSVVEVMKFKPTLSTSGGTSDARFFSEYGVEVAEIGVCNDTIHAVNERVCLTDLHNLSAIFTRVIQNFKNIL